MAPKWSLKQDWLGQWGTGAWLCPQGHHQLSAQPKYQAENAGFGVNSIFTYSTKIKTGISIGYSTWKDGPKAIRTFSSHPQLSIHLLGFWSFCHQAVPPRGMTYIYTWNLNASVPWNIKIRFFFSPNHICRNQLSQPFFACSKDTECTEPKSRKTYLGLWGRKERSAKDECISHMYILKQTIPTINPFLCPFLLQELPEPSPRVNSGGNVQVLQQPGKNNTSHAVSTLKGLERDGWSSRQQKISFSCSWSSLPCTWSIQDATGGKPFLVKLPGEQGGSRCRKRLWHWRLFICQTPALAFYLFCSVLTVSLPCSPTLFFLLCYLLVFSIFPLSNCYSSLPQEHSRANPHLPCSLHLPAPRYLPGLFSFHNQIFSSHEFLIPIKNFLISCVGLIEKTVVYWYIFYHSWGLQKSSRQEKMIQMSLQRGWSHIKNFFKKF